MRLPAPHAEAAGAIVTTSSKVVPRRVPAQRVRQPRPTTSKPDKGH